MGDQKEKKVTEKKIDGQLKADKKVFSVTCTVKKGASLLFVSKTKKVLKRSEANNGKGEIVISDKTVDIKLQKGEAEKLVTENEFKLWINEDGKCNLLGTGTLANQSNN